MFDLNDTIELVMPTPDGEKICEVRHPTEEEWCARYEQRQTVIRNVGKGETESKILHREESDLNLLSAIQKNKDVAFDGAEAVTLMDQLSMCDLVDVQRDGKLVQLTFSTLLGEVTHTLKMPGHAELKSATEDCVRVRGGRTNQTTVSIKLKPALVLYDKIAESVEGYNPADPKLVPAYHKYKVIDALQGEINNLSVKAKKAIPLSSPGR